MLQAVLRDTPSVVTCSSNVTSPASTRASRISEIFERCCAFRFDKSLTPLTGHNSLRRRCTPTASDQLFIMVPSRAVDPQTKTPADLFRSDKLKKPKVRSQSWIGTSG